MLFRSDRIPERPRGERSELHGVIALDALLGPELQANGRIVAGVRDPPMQRKELLGADKDSLQLEQACWQTCLSKDRVRRKAEFFQLSRQRRRNSESVAHGFADSITLFVSLTSIFGTDRR